MLSFKIFCGVTSPSPPPVVSIFSSRSKFKECQHLFLHKRFALTLKIHLDFVHYKNRYFLWVVVITSSTVISYHFCYLTLDSRPFKSQWLQITLSELLFQHDITLSTLCSFTMILNHVLPTLGTRFLTLTYKVMTMYIILSFSKILKKRKPGKHYFKTI